jgi:predicted nuclease of predicted toxin-antitoxin system
VKLLFDQNLSPRLVAQLADVFADSLHVRQASLDRADDDAIWRFARDNGFAIVTKDSDFQERSQMAASAPRIVWIRRGNCSTQDIETMLRKHALQIAALERETDHGFVVLL